ncbi:MAG: type I glyceraldehyde-3-phosphate dehydrogenase, partial [Nitrospinota bacterium]|nr:type I glyceraldehyde-3-phosphate dehydrogenase [Nitrospinota bacterium]
LAHLCKYDSVHGTNAAAVSYTEDALILNGKSIKILSYRDPGELPWKELQIDLVIESTGIFTKRDKAGKHLDAGAKKVIISAPATDPDITVVLGVNEDTYDAASHRIISNASCTTNCVATVAKVLNDRFGIKRGLMTTIHSFTNDQRILDLPHKDLRRARAASMSMIPTTTGAAKAVGLVLPELQGKLDGMAIRVPTTNVSLVDLVTELNKDTTAEEINQSFKDISEKKMKDILQYEETPLVSIDFNGNAASSIVDGPSTSVIDSRLTKVLAWYDNEWGYSSRVKDLVRFVFEKGL